MAVYPRDDGKNHGENYATIKGNLEINHPKMEINTGFMVLNDGYYMTQWLSSINELRWVDDNQVMNKAQLS